LASAFTLLRNFSIFVFRESSRFVFLQTKRLTSARIRAHPSAKTTMCRSSFPARSTKFVVDLGEAGLSPQDQKELDQQEGSNEVVD
jgi:hypothetical protein